MCDSSISKNKLSFYLTLFHKRIRIVEYRLSIRRDRARRLSPQSGRAEIHGLKPFEERRRKRLCYGILHAGFIIYLIFFILDGCRECNKFRPSDPVPKGTVQSPRPCRVEVNKAI